MRLFYIGILLVTCLPLSLTAYSSDLTRESYCEQAHSEIRQVSTLGKLMVMTQYGNGHLQQASQLSQELLPASVLNQTFEQLHLKHCFSYMSDNALYNRDEKQVANIQFDFDQANIAPLATQSLHGIAQKFANQSDMQLKITGHTDNWGSDSYNQGLSMRRAINSADIIIYQGVNRNNIAIEGFGESKPISDNSTEYGRSLNRRTIIHVVE